MQIVNILYTYKFLRDVLFKAFVVNWPSAKFSPLKFYWQNFGLHQSESRILVNSYIGVQSCMAKPRKANWGHAYRMD